MAFVLIVEDSVTQANLIARTLEAAGFQTQCAMNGVEALSLMQLSLPEVVLTDLQMPEMNGLELVEAVREQYPLVPTILMTAQGSEEIAIQALQKGAASYVPKRNLARTLIETVNSVLATARAGRSSQRLGQCTQEASMRFVLDNDCTLIPPLVDLLRRNATELLECDENEGLRLGVALEEALLNALYSGNLEVKSDLAVTDPASYQRQIDERLRQAPYRHRRIHVEARLSRREAAYTIRDEGPGFAALTPPEPGKATNLDDLTHRSRLLIRTFMDEVFYNDLGNEVTLVKRGRR